MQRRFGFLWIVGFLGVLAAAEAPAPASAQTQFDGTYRFVSSTKVNQTYTTRQGQFGQCPDRNAGPLTIKQGQAQYTSATGHRLRGTVGPQGELTMRSVSATISRPIELNANGTVDGTGTVHARQIANSCSYDFVWQK